MPFKHSNLSKTHMNQNILAFKLVGVPVEEFVEKVKNILHGAGIPRVIGMADQDHTVVRIIVCGKEAAFVTTHEEYPEGLIEKHKLEFNEESEWDKLQNILEEMSRYRLITTKSWHNVIFNPENGVVAFERCTITLEEMEFVRDRIVEIIDTPTADEEFAAERLDYVKEWATPTAFKQIVKAVVASANEGYVILDKGDDIPVGSECYNSSTATWEEYGCTAVVNTGVFRIHPDLFANQEDEENNAREAIAYMSVVGNDKDDFAKAAKAVATSIREGFTILKQGDVIPDGAETWSGARNRWEEYRHAGDVVICCIIRVKDQAVETDATTDALVRDTMAYVKDGVTSSTFDEIIKVVTKAYDEGWEILEQGDTVPLHAEIYNYYPHAHEWQLYMGPPGVVVNGVLRVASINIDHAIEHYTNTFDWDLEKLNDTVRTKVLEGYRVLQPGESLDREFLTLNVNHTKVKWGKSREDRVKGLCVTFGINVVKE